MTDEQLKQAVQFNRRPDRYMKGDRVIVRAPEGDENHSQWSGYKCHEGKVGTFTSDNVPNSHYETGYVDFDSGGSSVFRAQWIELYEPRGDKREG